MLVGSQIILTKLSLNQEDIIKYFIAQKLNCSPTYINVLKLIFIVKEC